MNEVVKNTDISIICGHRGEADQSFAFKMGHSKVRWPNSKHNSFPSLAVDIAPFPIDWNNIQRFKEVAVAVKQCWDALPEEVRDGWTLQWGGDWKTFKDFPHFELKK